MNKIEIIIRHTSAGQTHQFYGVNHYEPDEALRRFHAISTEADEMHWRMLQDSEMEPSPTPDLLEALKDMLSLLGDAGVEDEKTWQPGQYWIFREDKVSAKNRIALARAAIAKANRRHA